MKKPCISKAVVCCIIGILLSISLIGTITADASITKHDAIEYASPAKLRDGTSVICGFTTDIVTGLAIANVQVNIDWEDSEGHDGWNSTYTTDAGFYLFTTGPVEFRLYFYPDDYFNEYSDLLTVGEDQTFWYNLSLTAIPDQTASIQGYITDNATGEPISEANSYIYWNDEEHSWSNYTYSNSSGYYHIGAIPGIVRMSINFNNYYSYHSEELFLENNSLLWFNISLIPYPTVSVIVRGFITDAQLGNPIPDASVSVHCYTPHGQFSNYTNTDEIGYYSIGTIPGTVRILSYESNYESTSSPEFVVTENETYWVNLSLTFQPDENAIVKGYVTDGETHAAVRNAFVQYNWKDEVGHFYGKSTFTDQKGYYWITAPEGTVQFFITGNGYTLHQTPWFFLNQSLDHWLNASLEPEISIQFEKPLSSIYINNQSRFPLLSKVLFRVFPGSIPLIIGPLQITVNVTNASIQGCSRVEFYIDGVYLRTDAEEPYTYDWTTKGFLKHTIQVIAYDNAGPCTIESITVTKFM